MWDPEASADTSRGALYHKHKITPYADLPLKGRVLATYVRGSQVFDAGKGVARDVCGMVQLHGAGNARGGPAGDAAGNAKAEL